MKKVFRRLLAGFICVTMLTSSQVSEVFAASFESAYENDGMAEEEGIVTLAEDEVLNREADNDNLSDSKSEHNDKTFEIGADTSTALEEDDSVQKIDRDLTNTTTVTKNAAYIKYFNWNGTGVVTNMKDYMYWMSEDGSKKVYPDEVTDTGVYIFYNFYGDFGDSEPEKGAWDLWVDYNGEKIRCGGIKVFGRNANNTYPDGQSYCDSFFTAKSLSEYCPGNNYDGVKWHTHLAGYQQYADDYGENHSNEMIYCAWIEEPWDVEWYSQDGAKYLHMTSKKNDGDGKYHTGGGNIIFGYWWDDFGELYNAYSRHYCQPQYNYDYISLYSLGIVDDAQFKSSGAVIDGKQKWQRDGDGDFYSGNLTFNYRTNWSNASGTYSIPVENITEQPIRWYEYDENAEYTLTYDKNDGSGSALSTFTYHTGASISVIGQGNLSRRGYIFGGWNTKKDGSGTTYGEGSQIHIRNNTTLYAYWVPVSEATKIEINDTLMVLRSESSTTKDLYYFDVDDPSGEISIYLNLKDSEYSGEYNSAPYKVALYDESEKLCSIDKCTNPTGVAKNDDKEERKKRSVFYNIKLPKGRYYLSIIGADGISSIKTNYSIAVKQTWFADFVLG